MSFALLAGTAALATHAFWRIAHVCAVRRRLAIGTFPPYAQLIAAAAVALTASTGANVVESIACAAAIVAAIADCRTGAIFDPLNAALLIAAIAVRAATGSLLVAVAGTAVCGGSLLLLYLMTRGRGLGLGDVKFGFAAGAALGPATGEMALGAAFVGGAAYGVWLLASKRATRTSAIRFGPFLAAGAYFSLLARAAA
jgi:leader peptidase (prepilin peptidase)/N-methyltransferase